MVAGRDDVRLIVICHLIRLQTHVPVGDDDISTGVLDMVRLASCLLLGVYQHWSCCDPRKRRITMAS